MDDNDEILDIIWGLCSSGSRIVCPVLYRRHIVSLASLDWMFETAMHSIH